MSIVGAMDTLFCFCFFYIFGGYMPILGAMDTTVQNF